MVKKISIITRHYAPEPIGSAPVMQGFAKWFSQQGYKVSVTTVRPSYPYKKIWPEYASGKLDNTIEEGVYVHRHPTVTLKGSGVLAHLIPEALFCLTLWKSWLLKKNRPEGTIVSLCPSILTIFAVIPFARKGTHVALVHDIPSGFVASLAFGKIAKMLSSSLRHLETWCLNRADIVVTLSSSMKSQLIRQGVKTHILIAPPQVDANELRPSVDTKVNRNLLLYSGNLGKKQALDQVLELAAQLMVRAPQMKIVIQGDGSQAALIKERIDQLCLTNVRLKPLVPRSQLRHALLEGGIHLVTQHPSSGEFAVPSKVYSIMAVGRTFVATAAKKSELWDLKRETDAFICIAAGDTEQFVAAILALSEDTPRLLELGQNGHEYVKQHVSLDVVMEFYRSLVDGMHA